MTKAPISIDATIADLINDLNAPLKYVQGVLEQMWKCKELGIPAVRIGILGGGRIPNYRIEVSQKDDNKPAYVNSYYGSNHERIPDLGEAVNPADYIALGDETERPLPEIPERVLHDEHWSSRTMGLQEIGELRNRLVRSRR